MAVLMGDCWYVTCRRCKEEKPEDCFTPSQLRHRNYLCKPCANIVCNSHQKTQAEKYALKAAARRHAITVDEILQMREDQGGACAICRRQETMRLKDGRVRSLSIDHDHKTGWIRGLLCSSCNRALGYMYDSPERLENAAAYLRKAGH
jgi:hypothetical protein